MMNKIDSIKACQIAACQEKGEPSPYDNPAGQAKPGSNKALNRLQQLQADRPAGVMATAPDNKIKGDLAHYQTALKVDIGKVKNQKYLVDKARVKQAVLPTYLPFVDGYVESGVHYPNNVAVQVMIWLLDIDEVEHGLTLALHLQKQGQKMPPKFDRDMATFLCDMFYDWANTLLKDDQGASPYLDTLVSTAETDNWDVHPLCMSKLYVILAKHKLRSEDFELALALCEKAEAINPEKAGVKGLKEMINSKLKDKK